MRIICPACDTTYDVPQKVLVAGRKLRCARCRSEWIPVPEQAQAATSLPDHPGPPPAMPALPAEEPGFGWRAPSSPPPVARVAAGPRVVVIAAWLVSIMALGGMVVAAVALRAPIERIWPPSARAYMIIEHVPTVWGQPPDRNVR